MGDYSNPCAISGLPIQCGASVIALPCLKVERGDRKYVPYDLPFRGRMGSYGEIDEPSPITEYPKGVKLVYFHKQLFYAAGLCWVKAMGSESSRFKDTSFYQQVTDQYDGQRLAERVHRCGGEQELVDSFLWHKLESDTRYGKILHDLTILAPGFGRDLPIVQVGLKALREGPDNYRHELRKVEDTCAVFCATRIVGREIIPGDESHYCFEQYPTFKPEHMWYKDVISFLDERIRCQNDDD